MTIPPSRLATAVAAAVALGLAFVLLSVGGRAPRVAAVALAASDAVPAQSLTLLRTLVTNRAAATRHPPPYRPTAVAGARLDDALTPLLSAAELATLQYYVRGKDTYMEWGSGASTVMVAPLAGRGAWSVENQASWCVTMLERADVAFWGANGLLRYECVDIGETGDFGRPLPGSDPVHFADYVNAVDTFGVPVFDAVLVDGRFRVACALKALQYTDSGSVVFIHDYFQREAMYGAVMEFYDLVDRADSLVVLAPKALDVNATARATALLDEYVRNPA